MKNILKIGLPLLAVVLIVVGVSINKKGASTTTSPLQKQITEQDAVEVTPSAPTGNISDIAASFNNELTEESALTASTNSDGTIATSDSGIISNYGNTYDETKF